MALNFGRPNGLTMVHLFIPKESREGEARVATVPETAKALHEIGLQVSIESQAGQAAGFLDSEYQAAGAQVTQNSPDAWKGADIVLSVNPPEPEKSAMLKEGALVICFFQPALNPDSAAALCSSKASVFAMERVPRTTAAQKMDALSSQANTAGYKAALLAATTLGRWFPLMMTAAGTVKPAKVVVFGAGVAGLQAIATARRLGAQVQATDIRPEVKEQVESLGGKFIEVEAADDAEASVYAEEASEEYKKKQKAAVASAVKEANVVITTALVPGASAPVLLSEEMVESMSPGSVVVDMAAIQGGNCSLTQKGQTITHKGIKILGPIDLAATVPTHASELYSRNLLQVIQHLCPEGALTIDINDEITGASLAIKDGKEI